MTSETSQNQIGAALMLRARQAFQAGDHGLALRLAETHLAQHPDDTDALEITCLVAQARKDFKASEAILNRVIALRPATVWAHHDLIEQQYRTGNVAGAELSARNAVVHLPDDAQSHMWLGVIFGDKDDLPSAEFHNREALRLAGPHPQILINLGLNLYHQGRLDEAEAAFLAADRSAPGNAMLWAHLSRLYDARGDRTQALAALDRAEQLSVKTGDDFSLLRIRYLRESGAADEALKRLEVAPPSSMNGSALLEKARCLDALKRHDKAWPALNAAKATLGREMGVTYDADLVSQTFAALKATFTRDTFSRLPSAGVRKDRPQPIFILGFPRSGTTLIEQVLSSHPKVSAGGELPFVHHWQGLIEKLLPGNAPFPQRILQATIRDHHHLAAGLRDDYLARAQLSGLFADGATHFTDKMPLNDVYLPLIKLVFPESPVIRLRRHPLDVMMSMLSHNLTHGYFCGYAPETIAAHMLAMHDLDTHYAAHLKGSGFDLRYEDFVASQEAMTRAILAEAGLEFDPACFDFHRNKRHAPTPSYAQVTEPLNDRSIGRYQAYLKPLTPFIDSLKLVMDAHGYKA